MQAYAPPVLVNRLLPRTWPATAGAVAGFALLTALAAQVEIPLPFTPVPITAQTLVVLLSGAVLGAWAGASSQALYVVLGAVGLPFYAGGASGWQHAAGATGGYLIGFVLAAGLVGWLAQRKADRRLLSALGTFLLGNLVIYAVGVPWLAVIIHVSMGEALLLGMIPFVVGDLIKILLAGALLPAAWRLLE